MSERTLLIDSDGNRYLFDAVFSAAHSLSVAVTDHPVQSGAAVADHAYVEPETVTLEIGVSDAMTNAAAIAGASESRSVSAFQKLREIALARRPVSLITRLGTYSNMLVSSVSAEESADTMAALRAEITLKALNLVQTAEVSVQQTVSSSKIAYRTGVSGGAFAGYAAESSGGTQAAFAAAQNPQIEAALLALLERGELK